MKTEDRFLMDLNEDLALRCDPLQLIVSKRKGTRKNGKPRYENLKFTREGFHGVLKCLRQLAWREDLKLNATPLPSIADLMTRRAVGLCDRIEEING
ncbi:MAG: hypothetical protein NXI12_03800 [Alphaproteobacteria bacterium]|nr:hypothetical protein [Alphaproteobacteria bacterium]